MFHLNGMRLPAGVDAQAQGLWGSIGWATPAALGVAMAKTAGRTWLVTGDGSHQLTLNELAVMGRYGVTPRIFVLNNGLYGVEDIISERGHAYDDLAPVKYHLLPEAFGCTDWLTAKVSTVAELDKALADIESHDGAVYVEVLIPNEESQPHPNLGRVASALGLTVSDLYRSDVDTAGALVDLRVRAGLSQRDAAKLLGVSQATISRWERGLSRPTWDEISSYAKVLHTDRITIGTAIDLTANQNGNPPKTRRVVQPSAFTLTASSPHIIYDFEDSEGDVELSSPQFPRLAFRTAFTSPLMRELAVINEYFDADYFHRFNHLQRRCRGPEPDGAVYLIRWLPAFHETTDLETHKRGITAAMLIGQVGAMGFLTVGSRTLPTGEYLIVVVEPEDTLEFLFGQISRGVPVTFFPTRCDDGTGPLEILWEDGSDSPTGWHGAFRYEDMPAGMTFAELFGHLQSVNPPPWTAEATQGVPQTDIVRSIHRTFSKSTSRRQTRARSAAPQR